MVAKRLGVFFFYKDCQQYYLKGAGCHIAYSIASTNVYVDKPQGVRFKGCVFRDSPLTHSLLLRKQDYRCLCSRGIEKLHYASLLGRLQRDKEKSQVINQAMAELATLPYLHELDQQDVKLVSIYF